jgi:hypothetical protein
LRTNLTRLARETDVRHLPDYPPVQDARLVAALDRIQEGKRELGPKDRLYVETEDKVYEVDLSSTWEPTSAIPVTDAKETHSFGELILTIRRPDFIRDTMWQFAHGKSTISAPILDQEWLEEFRERKIVLLPGDALRCRVKFTYLYDDHGELIGQRTEIEKVLEVIPGSGEQRKLFT